MAESSTRLPPGIYEALQHDQDTVPEKQAQLVVDETPKSYTKGERAFNLAVYGGIAGVATFLGGLWVCNIARHGSAKPMVDGYINGMKSMGMNKTTIDGMVTTTVFGVPGHIAVLPIKYFENHKEEIVHRLNQTMDPERADEPLQDTRKQTWGTLFKGRVAAVTAVLVAVKAFGGVFGGDKLDKFEEGFAKNVICKPLGYATHIGGKETLAYRLGRIGALDVFCTSSAAALLYSFSKFFSKNEAKYEATPGALPNVQIPNAMPDSSGGDVQQKRFTDAIPSRHTQDGIAGSLHASASATIPIR